MEKTFEIPKMDYSKLFEWYKNISVIVNRDGKSTFLRKLTEHELSHTAFYLLSGETNFGEEVNYAKLKPLTDVKMLHTYGYYGFFKPTVAEVIRQIPKEFLCKVTAFEIIEIGDTNTYKEELNAGYHVSIVRLYGKKK